MDENRSCGQPLGHAIGTTVLWTGSVGISEPATLPSVGGTDGLSVSTSDLACAGSQVTSTNEPASRCASALAGVGSVVGTPQVGMGIGSAATAFCASLVSGCTGLSGAAANHGAAISQVAQLYATVDDDAATGFDQIHTASLAI